MGRFSTSIFTGFLLLALCFALSGCGDNAKSTVGPVAKIAVSPSSVSLNQGEVFQISAVPQDSNGTRVASATVTFSSDSGVASIANNGLICAGTWDSVTTPVVCTPGQTGPAQIKASSAGISSDAVAVFVHRHVDRLSISGAADCVSAGQQAQLTARALSCAGANCQNPVEIPASELGPVTWTIANSSVATIDANGLLTAVAPGTTFITAAVSQTASAATSYTTCLVQSIGLALKDQAGVINFTADKGATVNLVPDVVDTKNAHISALVTYSSSASAVASVSSAAVVTANTPGTASIVASCTPPSCNVASFPVYSNVVLGSVNGTSATTVYVTGTDSQSLLPIDTTTNTPAVAAVALPNKPNSLVFNPAGTKAFLGSSGGLMVFDPASNTVTNNANISGKVLAVAPDGSTVIVSDISLSEVFIFNVASLTATTLSLQGVIAAGFSPDGFTALALAAGGTVYPITLGRVTTSTLIAGPATDVAMLASGAFAYAAGASLVPLATCNASAGAPLPPSGNLTLLKPTPDGRHMLAADSPNIDDITVTSSNAGCPPPLQQDLNSFGFGTAFQARQLKVSPDGKKAYILSDLDRILVYDIASRTISPPIATGVPLVSGDFTPDSKMFWAADGANTVHRIDVAAGQDVQQITVTLAPNLVAVRPK